MTQISHPAQNLLENLDGFRVEIDATRQRADIILQRPPFNIISMPERDQLRLVFEALDADDRVRVIVLRAEGEHFSSGGTSRASLRPAPSMCRNWHGTLPPRLAAASR